MDAGSLIGLILDSLLLLLAVGAILADGVIRNSQ